MLSVRFAKNESAIYISHIDILRGINRTFRRMTLPVEYSKGFNPHMLLNLSQPLPLGIASKGEWVTIDTDYKDTLNFLELYNKYCVPGFEASECHYTAVKPNIAGKVTVSDYFIYSEKAIEFKNELESLKNLPLIMKTKTKKGIIDKDVSELIFDIKVNDEGIFLRLAFGNRNLRIDRLAEKLNEVFSFDIKHTDIVRLSQLLENKGEYIEVSEYLKGLE